MSSVLYGCEAWFNGDLKPVEKLYNWAVKQLLGVRMTTCTNICYVELGLPPLKYLVINKQRKFFRRLWEERQCMMDDPWAHVVKLVLATNTVTCKHIRGLISDNINDTEVGLNLLKRSVSDSTSSRRVTYRQLNPDLSVDVCYLNSENVSEFNRIAYSQFRLSGHKLAIETGRWNRRGRGRLPVEERLCPCGSVQTEIHVLESCPLTNNIRNRYSFTSWRQLMDMRDQFNVPMIIYAILSCYT